MGYPNAEWEGAEFWSDSPQMEDARLDDGRGQYAILYVGTWYWAPSWPGNEDFELDLWRYLTESMYHALVSGYGYDPQNVHILFANEPELVPGPHTYVATYENLEYAFQQIGSQIDSTQGFFFWASDHGNQIAEPSTLVLLSMGVVAVLACVRRRRRCGRAAPVREGTAE